MRKIIFEKWLDPFMQYEEGKDDDFEDNSYAFARRSFLGKDLTYSKYKGQVLNSPIMGIIPLGEHNLQSKRYNMWIGHTNFHITKKEVRELSQVDGVEVLKIFSPYRFWLGVGFLFNEEEVKNNIIKKLTHQNHFHPDLLKKLSSKFKSWAIIKKPDNKYFYYHGNSQEEVEFKLEKNKNNIKKVAIASWQIK